MVMVKALTDEQYREVCRDIVCYLQDALHPERVPIVFLMEGVDAFLNICTGHFDQHPIVGGCVWRYYLLSKETAIKIGEWLGVTPYVVTAPKYAIRYLGGHRESLAEDRSLCWDGLDFIPIRSADMATNPNAVKYFLVPFELSSNTFSDSMLRTYAYAAHRHIEQHLPKTTPGELDGIYYYTEKPLEMPLGPYRSWDAAAILVEHAGYERVVSSKEKRE